jgi:hypothetical protein
MILSASAEVWRNRRVDVPESRSLSSRNGEPARGAL